MSAPDEKEETRRVASERPFLAVVGGLPFHSFRLSEGELIAGRLPECGLRLDHPEVSRQHCRFEVAGGECTISDLGSRWGTKVNLERIADATVLRAGDKIALGPVTLLFGVGEPPAHDDARSADLLPVHFQGKAVARIPLGGEIVFGREADADVVLSDPAVSRRHAAIRPAPNGWQVADLRSTAGAFVNGQRFDTHDLVIGDRLQFGPFHFQFDGQALNRVRTVAGGGMDASGVALRVGDVAVLQDVSLSIAPATFTGIIGPSGAGKSSLLGILGGMRPPSSGQVASDGVDLYASGTPPVFGFVPQDDLVHPELTIVQALRFAAELRLPRGTPPLEMQKLVIQTMQHLGLRERAGTRIGSLSGGQRKRVSVGVELLARPPILFLDEPTSGLDPATEFKLMELLRDLADGGCTIICTTHVMENVYLVDQLAVMAAGRLVFCGTPQEVRDHFGVNRLSALYDRLEGASGESAVRSVELVRKIAPKPGRALVISHWSLGILLRRQWAILCAEWKNLALLIGQPLIIAALLSWASNDDALLLFFACVATLWFGASNAAPEIVREIAIYRRERIVGVGRNSYLASKFTFMGAITAAQAVVLYLGLQLGEGGLDGAVAWQLGALLGLAAAAVGIGCAISALARNVLQAVLIVPLALIPFIVFSGHPIPAHEMSPAVAKVAQFTPSYAARTLVDMSFLWRKEIARSTLSDHWTSFRNLNRAGDIKTGEVFARTAPATGAATTLGGWILGAWFAGWFALKRRERS